MEAHFHHILKLWPFLQLQVYIFANKILFYYLLLFIIYISFIYLFINAYINKLTDHHCILGVVLMGTFLL